MSKVPKFQFEGCPPAKVAKPAKLPPAEASTFATLATFARGKNENQLFHLQDETPQAADERGDQDHTPPSKVVNLHPDAAPQISPRERILTCYECGHFRPAVNSPNPTQAWGYCEKRDRGRYGVAMACESILAPPDAIGEAICPQAGVGAKGVQP